MLKVMVSFSKRNVMFTSVCTTCNKTGYGIFLSTWFGCRWFYYLSCEDAQIFANVTLSDHFKIIRWMLSTYLEWWMQLVCFFPLGNWPCGLIGSASVWVIVYSNWDSCWLLVWSDCRVKIYWPSLSNQSFMSVNAINILAYFMWIGLERHSISMWWMWIAEV